MGAIPYKMEWGLHHNFCLFRLPIYGSYHGYIHAFTTLHDLVYLEAVYFVSCLYLFCHVAFDSSMPAFRNIIHGELLYIRTRRMPSDFFRL